LTGGVAVAYFNSMIADYYLYVDSTFVFHAADQFSKLCFFESVGTIDVGGDHDLFLLSFFLRCAGWSLYHIDFGFHIFECLFCQII
jgi:hypothetical protein